MARELLDLSMLSLVTGLASSPTESRLSEIREDPPIGLEVGALGAELGHHVGQGHATRKAQIGDTLTDELHAPIQATVGAQASDDVERYVFRADPLSELADDLDLNGFRYLKPELAGRPDGGHLATTDAGTEGAHPAEVGSVTVGTENELPRRNERLFAEHLMADPGTDLEEVLDSLLGDEATDLSVILRMSRCWCGHRVIERDRHPGRVPDLGLSELQPNLPDGGAVVVAERHVGTSVDDLSDLHGVEARGSSESLLSKALRLKWHRSRPSRIRRRDGRHRREEARRRRRD